MMREWMERPFKLAEYFEPVFGDVGEAERQIYFAVIRGEVRARHRGKIFGPKELQKLARRKWAPDSDFGLPPDIELNTEDAKRVFAGTQTDRSRLN